VKIAFLGLGRMGHELVRHLATKTDHTVVAWNRTPRDPADYEDVGVTLVASSEDAVSDADVVVTMLFGTDAVREVVSPLLPKLQGKLWIDVTTVSPDEATGFAAEAEANGVRYVHSPVIGSTGPAHEGTLGVLVGGHTEDVADARRLVSAWADPDRLRACDTPAQAALFKLIANLALAVAGQGIQEALRLGATGGLSAGAVMTHLAQTPLGALAGLKGDMVRDGAYDRTEFSVDLLAKDIRLMLQTSELPLPATTAAFVSLERARGEGRGGEDFATIAADL